MNQRGELQMVFGQLALAELPPTYAGVDVSVVDLELPMRLNPQRDEGTVPAYFVVVTTYGRRLDARNMLNPAIRNGELEFERALRRFASEVYLHRGVLAVVRFDKRE